MLRKVLISLFPMLLAAQSAQMPQDNPMENKIVGRIGDVIYRESDFFDYLPIVLEAAQVEQIRNSPELQEQYHSQFMESMLLLHHARRESIEQTPEFQARLRGITNYLMIQQAIDMNVPNLISRSTPAEEQLKAFYEENIENFKAPDTASARHILVMAGRPEGEAGQRTDEEALARMAIAQQELSRGKSWEEVAKDYSDDPGSNQNGGLYEDFNPAHMVPEFAEAVRTQEIGVIGRPVKTQFGYHLILVEDRNIDVMQTFDEAKNAIQQQLSEKMRADAWREWLDSLKAELGYVQGEAATSHQ